MKIMNYMNLNRHPVYLSFMEDRTDQFAEIYHAHQGMEFLYVHEGDGQIIVNQQVYNLSPGSFFYFRPFQLHRIHPKPGAPYVRSLFLFEPSELDRYLAPFASLRALLLRLRDDQAVQPPCRTDLPQQAILRLIEDTEARIRQAPSEHLLEEQILFLIAFLQQMKTYGSPGSKNDPNLVPKFSVAERVMEWVESHYMKEFSLKQLAGEVHLTPNHISAVFRQTVGTSITEYLTARRIRQACFLLKTSELSIQEVGQSIGLTNTSYFCQLFKKHVGVSPYRFKRNNA
ncbi:helix-turn-helix transcriptional regulator [Paenibacillus soyae]|uniref:AraC family transcriptional regulator n=1 Tax=Paenibacillus soyae TaxID=2969249 RepID=A0A9X2MU36_9BACL|nr:AraC family transcriptional regulator [Paenibacillus soyae]MCR2806859.1 AraC family transcriptional regulator [Paenibacillus soyae]